MWIAFKRSGQDKPEPIRTWYQYKSLYLSCDRPIDEIVLSPKLTNQLRAHFRMAAPLYHYIHRVASQTLDERR